jgi:acetyl-CoA acetyltransferase family protein
MSILAAQYISDRSYEVVKRLEHEAGPDDAVIVAARRSPIGRRNGMLASVHPHDLLVAVQNAALNEVSMTDDRLDMIITGCVTQVGDQSYNVGRMGALSGGLRPEVPAMTVDAQCGSSHQAVNLAAGMVRSGAAEVVLASGVEAMSRVPLGSAQSAGFGTPYSDGYVRRYELVGQGESAERIADRWDVARVECDAWAAISQQRAAAATDEGRFEREIVPLDVDGVFVTRDQGIRESSPRSLGALKAAFRVDGRHTAGNSSQISDGAAAVVITSRAAADRLGLKPLVRVAGQAFVGVDPVLKLTGPIPATRALLDRAGLVVGDIDLFEVSEAFASVVLAWFAEIGANVEQVNVNGGAIALGHPVGASGARMITTATHELARSQGQFAVVTMCCGGGLGTATLLAVE